MANRLLLGAWAAGDGDDHFRISRPTFDVLDPDLDPNSIAFDSAFTDTFLVFASGSFLLSGESNSMVRKVSWTDLGYIPMAAIAYAGSLFGASHAYANLNTYFSGSGAIRVYVKSDGIYVNGAATANIQYLVFRTLMPS